MIYCKLIGGLGNQLFQIFATISFSIENECMFSFSTHTGCNSTNRRHTYWQNLLKNVSKYTIDNQPAEYVYVKEPCYSFNNINSMISCHSCQLQYTFVLQGYFQSYKYFEKYYREIYDAIDIDYHKQSICKRYPRKYENMISMHFRLGDYKNIQDKHPILPYKYYKDALEYIIASEKHTRVEDNALIHNHYHHLSVLYFCEMEDIKCVDTIIGLLRKKYPHIHFIHASKDASNDTSSNTSSNTSNGNHSEDWEQMLMMSLCKHNIIANSSFSWWGAYLNNDVNKIVCYPSLWFGPSLSHNKTHDLFPSHWTKI